MGKHPKLIRDCGDEHILKGREPTQMGWYQFARHFVDDKSVLDVGCGSGEGLKLLELSAHKAVGIDLDPRLKRDNVEIIDISEVPSDSFDCLVCIDVIEHVEKDRQFVEGLVRVARNIVFATTPNYAVSRNEHPYHIREYLPNDFEKLFLPYGKTRLYGGNYNGVLTDEIVNKQTYYFLNWLHSLPSTVLLAKILKRILFAKVWSHTAILLTLDQ